jgi:membrane protease YdiL (CAAX protease family)
VESVPVELRVLVTLGFGLLLILLRLDAERFGAAEYDEAGPSGDVPSFRRRLAWYVTGFALVIAAALVHPAPDIDLRLAVGDRLSAVIGGIAFAVGGSAQAAAFAWYRYRHLRLPPLSSYPGALVNGVATAIIDEAAFRGILLGFLLAIGVEPLPAVAMQAILYALATRLGAPGRHPYMLVLALAIGLAGGALTVATGGIGAAIFGHAITRFAGFLCTGHAGRIAARGTETEEVERRRRVPDGWSVVGARDVGGGDR